MHWAAANGRADATTVLLDHGAEVGVENGNHQTPLDCAIKYGHTTIVELLENAADFGTVADAHAALDAAATKPQRHADRVTGERKDKRQRQPGG